MTTVPMKEPSTPRENEALAASGDELWPRFVSGLAHELRTPLASLGMLVELLEREGTTLSAKEKRYVDNIRELAREMQQLVGDVGTFARLKGGRSRRQEEPLVLEDLVRRLTDGVRTAAWEKGVTVSSTLEPKHPPAIRGDPTLLEQALEAMLETVLLLAEREVSLRVEVRDAEVTFTVTGDGGCGPAEDSAALFDPFEGGTARRLRQKGARPLAPLLAREIARELGGDLALAGALAGHGDGSRWVLRLPLAGAGGAGVSA